MGGRFRVLILALIGVLAFWTLLLAQNQVPVIQDGTPAVLARNPAPRTREGKPDLSGVWSAPSTDEAKILVERFGVDKPEPAPLTPWSAERYEYNRDSRPSSTLEGYPAGTFGGRPELNPEYHCLPAGTAFLTTGWGSISPMEIIQSAKRVQIFYEYDHTIRQIWTDGRKHPDPVDLTWVGHSIGSWDGDTLVVDTVGMRPEFWLDRLGHVASAGLRITERYRRVDNDTIELVFTYDDSKAFTKPWTRRRFLRLRPNWEIIEGDVRCYPGSQDRNAQEQHFDQLFTTQ